MMCWGMVTLSFAQAGARLCKCLKDEFVPYLPVVMPLLLKSALVEPDIKV
jgi:importin-5